MTTKMTPAEFRTTLALSRKAYAVAKADREAEEAHDHANGHRSHYCIHGTDQWTDYDNICGGCEDGIGLRQMVVESVWADVLAFRERLAWVSAAPGGLPYDTSNSLWSWCAEPLSRPAYQ